MRVLTWNLFHGRAVPERRHELSAEYTDMIAGWAWDVALLQEVPPWWPVGLARAAGASARMARTSRNWLLPARRALAQWRPDLIKSGGGGANAILVRGRPIAEHRIRTLRHLPERRVMHAVRLGDGLWVANVHAQVRPHAATRQDLDRAGATLLAWAGGAPALLGGDVNAPDPHVAGFTDLGGHRVDRFLARGLVATGRPRRLERHGLSDHAPVVIELAPAGRNPAGAASKET